MPNTIAPRSGLVINPIISLCHDINIGGVQGGIAGVGTRGAVSQHTTLMRWHYGSVRDDGSDTTPDTLMATIGDSR